MTPLPTPWRKPASLGDSHGPELRLCGGHIEIRNSRDPYDVAGREWFVAFSQAEFAALVLAIRTGEYDNLTPGSPDLGVAERQIRADERRSVAARLFAAADDMADDGLAGRVVGPVVRALAEEIGADR